MLSTPAQHASSILNLLVLQTFSCPRPRAARRCLPSTLTQRQTLSV